jgi:hypothetical protein
MTADDLLQLPADVRCELIRGAVSESPRPG